MLKEVNWSADRSYRTNSENEPIQFYLDGLCNSLNFDLLLGYFSSAAINVLSLGFASFIHNGGTMRVIFNNILSKSDKDAVSMASEPDYEYNEIDLRDIKELRKTLNEYNDHFFQCLAYLISIKRIQIKIIKPKLGNGIAHFKSGIFSDEYNTIGFKASCNFTAYGLIENLEELDAFLSWENSRSTKMINRQTNDFNQIFNELDTNIEYLDVKNVEIAIQSEFGGKTEQELLIQEKELLIKKGQFLKNASLKKTIDRINNKIDEISSLPKFPYASGPREYQKDAYGNWVKNNYQGIFAMATGTGKTITSLNCLFEEFNKSESKTYHALILVPTLILVEQWENECKQFNFQDFILVSSKTNWESELATTLSISKRTPTSFIIIATYASFVKNKFQNALIDLPSDTILIADEAHNIGSPNISKLLSKIQLEKRIGLSATPKRNYDEIGSDAMSNFFNDKPPFTYSFSMERAIDEGILCKYYYYPHIVQLTNEELQEYIEISKKLARFFNINTGDFDGNDIAEMLLLKRKRILHKAENKLGKAISILKNKYEIEGSLNYSFIYVPEGSVTEESENGFSDEESIKIINQYTREIGRIDSKIRVNQFVSGMTDRNQILNQFKSGKINVLASMKCLDEGVDIPRAEFAIFCSSTGNPRQFIQRRGRILRKHPQKDIAIIHDLVVVPDIFFSNRDSETFKLERTMVEKEIERVMYFATLAINPHETEEVFNEICEHYELNIYTIGNKLRGND
ncbi:MAG: DEAD/DEAH box helicase family protein [Bacteroidia bacterium]|nr:DEAD/DEAH box helicase family protein [Bacteroidia bacterium]MCF8427829.1 DEAD/DEAH box helicase family protein [Bacteroidia bacterium]MCF8446696.1 DEAD/DEAH box helicase family protein [Bacteroidia bacterium]